jgi:hypothetical protein
MGKSCIRFKQAESLALDVIGDTIRSTSARAFIQHYEALLKQPRRRSGTDAANKPARSQARRKQAAPAGRGQ